MAEEGMREPTFLILTALSEDRLHGYGVIRSVLSLSDGRVRLRPGTVYGALDRLESKGLVTADGVEIEGGRRRRYFRITVIGHEALTAEVQRLTSNVRVARRALGRDHRLPQAGWA
jgi:DNA-binding PadR family transcriptional regulator